jgi:hypothetical protein
MVRVGLDEGADQGIASEPGLFLIALSDIAYAAAQAATKKRAASAPWGTIVIFGRAFNLRVGGRVSPSRRGHIQCIKTASV